MSFKNFERTPLNLSIFMMLSFGWVASACADDTASINPASTQACVALESNADRLACYDAIFKVDTASSAQAPVVVSEQRAAKELQVVKEEPQGLKAKIEDKVENLFSVHGAKIDPNSSLLDKRWELSPDSKLGTWNIRAHQPVYLLPAYWSSNKNEFPHSPNPQNTVDEAQDLKSTEAKFQISLKTKAVENLIGDNGDVWLGYTQSSRWQVYNEDESRPFRETNYEPEASLIFRTNYDILGLHGRLLGLTFNHQSNGRSDPLSRSWNRVMLNLGFEKDNFALMVRPWYRLDEDAKDDNNPDIKDYVGRGDVTAFYRWKENEFSLMLRHSLKGGDDSHGAAQFDWAFPIKGKLRGHFQLFDGYGESLIDYNHRATYVGLGVSLMNAY
ncbi:phospholipase A [Acinetobacter sichuanensis]|uniref:Phospholipase A1 n=1 Tax=Acinetobacter sichuanensis TaxID=2136183 RepID=A0A371YNV0_9GAMM|nr:MULTISPECIES: phospholipase A [Acinetobacter]MDM1247605.1 phospholipase A [Acinetobacter sp. R933-2]MDQ9022378.1 phospholipase A [Acinetobacter sichuanensis]RFC83139.1 phospholipase [Acinetobacter sichuanensis]